MFERLKRLFDAGQLNAAGIENAVKKGWITEEQVAQAKKIKTEVGEEATKNLKEVMLQKIAEGRVAKFLKEGCLLDQIFSMEAVGSGSSATGSSRPKKLLKNAPPLLL